MNLPQTPPDDLLWNMALRYDHGLGCDGYYDQAFFGNSSGDHQRRVESTLRQMRQLYEEVFLYYMAKEVDNAMLNPVSRSNFNLDVSL